MHEIFYDTETTGPEPKFDQVLQFAAIRVDEDLMELDTVDIRSRMSPFILPTPGALKVTGVDPNDIARAPFGAYDYARHLHGLLSSWNGEGDTDYSGWNTLHFDEEIMRQMFWQNLLDPYLSSGNGRRRVDYLTMTRALAARNPDLLTIPIREETGKPNFKLENIATANGFTGHNAHDALGDVRATIHMARLIRDRDPALYAHIKAMGSAKTAVDFVENETIFRIVGGPMIAPGILDVCLLASEKDNPKSKSAWNLAVDPTPYLDAEPEVLLEAMRKSGTPFRSVKCHKTPLIFPTGWEFLRHAAGTEAPDPATIDARSRQILEHPTFRANVAEALRLKVNAYEAPEHLEEKIYSGFPSWADKSKMQRFHEATNWSTRLDIARSFEKTELQQLAIRLIWANAPEVLSETHRAAIDSAVQETRFTMDTEAPWTTLGKFMKELEEWEEKLPGDAELVTIRAWIEAKHPVVKGETAPAGGDAHFLDGIE